MSERSDITHPAASAWLYYWSNDGSV